MASTSIELSQPYSLDATLSSGQAFRWRRAGRAFEGLVGEEPVRLRKRGAKILVDSRGDATNAVAAYLRTSDNLNRFYKQAAVDEPLTAAIERWRGLHLLRQDPWETTLSFIASSASNVPKIARSLEKMARSLGEPLEWQGSTFHRLPTPQRLARASISELRACEFGYRARYLHSTAKRVSEGEVDLSAIAKMNSARATQTLVAELDGVGPKVAACIALFSMGKDDAFPVDRWIQRRVGELYFQGRVAPVREVERWGRQRFGKWAGYAQQYLFHDGRAGKRAPLKCRPRSPRPSSRPS